MITSFTKYIPTDMDWHNTFHGGYCRVVMCGSLTRHYQGLVTICGTDDTELSRWTETAEEALAIYNNLKYIQGPEDLEAFYGDYSGVDNNGRPTTCPLSEEFHGHIHTPKWNWPSRARIPQW